MKVVFVVNVLIAIAAFVALMRMVLVQKVWPLLPSGSLPNRLKAGKYDIVVFGWIWGDAIKKLEVHVETVSGITQEVNLHFIPSTGMSKLRIFTRFASFRINAPAELKVVVSNISIEDIKRSRLLLRRLLFRRHLSAIEILTTPGFNYIKFFLLIGINVGSFLLLFTFL